MAGGEENSAEAAKLTGLGKYFNSITTKGRANVAMATYAGMGLLGLYFYLKPKKAPKS
ncbi:ATP synthase F(0) complex subunit k, mitochondrial-like [Rhynchophorus ferrugineus]|uniref:ATP synthase F(0) complex subunit k, mitochondrial-like n=1 Tax=Rhynchophorus ferrugineus TaxID=354439 RepID=UPI003FCD31ED